MTTPRRRETFLYEGVYYYEPSAAVIEALTGWVFRGNHVFLENSTGRHKFVLKNGRFVSEQTEERERERVQQEAQKEKEMKERIANYSLHSNAALNKYIALIERATTKEEAAELFCQYEAEKEAVEEKYGFRNFFKTSREPLICLDFHSLLPSGL